MLRLTGQIRVHRDWWLVVHLDPELGRYYRQGFNWHNRFAGLEIGDMKWGPHISFVRKEIPPNLHLWQPLHEVDVEVDIQPIYRTNGRHLWFNVVCNQLLDIRERLGLERHRVDDPPFYGLHLTLGVLHRKSPDDQTELVMPWTLDNEDDWKPVPRPLDDPDED